jgi:hypothetical protein
MTVRDLQHLAQLIATRNAVGEEIADLIGRPALIGHVGEFIASRVFRIRLQESASHKGVDGHFTDGPLAGRSVNIKWYPKRQWLLDVNPAALPGFYLVMTGPKSGAVSSRGGIRPWTIEAVFLFDAQALFGHLQQRGVKIGIATSVIQEQWRRAEIYPTPRNPALVLSGEQRRLLGLFR